MLAENFSIYKWVNLQNKITYNGIYKWVNLLSQLH